jgi:hypothetical protein
VDANGDGEISFDEFAEMMLKTVQWATLAHWALSIWKITRLVTSQWHQESWIVNSLHWR